MMAVSRVLIPVSPIFFFFYNDVGLETGTIVGVRHNFSASILALRGNMIIVKLLTPILALRGKIEFGLKLLVTVLALGGHIDFGTNQY